MLRCTVVSRVPCGSRLMTTMTMSSGSPPARLLKTRTFSSSAEWMVTLRSSWRAGCCAAGPVEAPDVRRERAALGLRGVPVADADLVLLGVEVLLAARPDGHVLVELVAGVHAPARRAGGRQHRADLEHRRAAVLQRLVEDVGGVDEEVRPHQVVGVVGELAEVVLDLPLGRAPGEVRVGLVVADRAERAHHRRPGERLGQEQHVGVGAADLAQQPLPERHRLGVRVVHAEDPDAVRHPQLDDPQHLAADAGRVVVEVDRVDVLVLLGRVLGVGDRAVGAGGEPLRVRSRPTGGRARTAAPGRGRSRGRAPWRGPRTRRSPRTCRGRGGWCRGRRPSTRSPTATRCRPGPGVRVLFGPLRLTSPIGWIGGR